MNQLPKDPVMLLSYLNTQLRDHYENLTELCAALSLNQNELCERLAGIDYHYSAERNQFV